MLQSMTGFGSKEADGASLGKVTVELRSTNHKFLEIVFHLPEGFLSLEDKIKKLIESRVKRGRVICAIKISGAASSNAHVNKRLLKKYLATLNEMKRELGIKDDVSFDALIHLPGVLSFGESGVASASSWPFLEGLISKALEGLVRTRQKEGASLHGLFKKRAVVLKADLNNIRALFKKAIKEKLKEIDNIEERSAFLKDTDITEEIERLAFHIQNFGHKLAKSGPIGKELDFIAQEMQREANTMAAKSFNVRVSARVVQIKSQIEKIREQVQNIE